MGNLVRIHVRYFCPRHSGTRVFPYDSLEARTVSPEPGKRGGEVLLRSFNAVSQDGKLAFCWAGKHWVTAEPVTTQEILRWYLAREGVEVRMQGRRSARRLARILHLDRLRA
jgi:hypothetical protein